MAATSLLVHPLHVHAARAAIVAPLILCWVVAVWGAGRFQWGVASGPSVGLFASCITLKALSFARAGVGNGRGSSGEGSVPKTGDGTCGGKAERVVDDATITQASPLTFLEFAYFMLAAPALVCEPRFLKVGARRRPRVARAFSEFFHAGLTFVAFHAACSALFAPALRVIATAAVPTVTSLWAASTIAGGGEANERQSDWVDLDGWAAIAADGNGAWLLWGEGWLEIAMALASSMLVFNPMVHFVMFYGFWHCLCLGFAELWGYPDRDLYGESERDARRPSTVFVFGSVALARYNGVAFCCLKTGSLFTDLFAPLLVKNMAMHLLLILGTSNLLRSDLRRLI